MASSLVFAGCGGAGASEEGASLATASQQVTESVSNDRRIIVYLTPAQELYAVDKNGNTQLLAQRSGKPVYSPDGTKVAYAKLPDTFQVGDLVTEAELYVFDTNAGRGTRLTQGHDDVEPIWAPDGRTVLFQSTLRSGMPSLWRVKDNGAALEQVTNQDCFNGNVTNYVPNPQSSETVDWATERRIIVYSTTSLTNGEVRILGFDRGLDVTSSYSLGAGYAPKWTDAGTVSFLRDVDGKTVRVEVSVE